MPLQEESAKKHMALRMPAREKPSPTGIIWEKNAPADTSAGRIWRNKMFFRVADLHENILAGRDVYTNRMKQKILFVTTAEGDQVKNGLKLDFEVKQEKISWGGRPGIQQLLPAYYSLF